MQKGLSVFSSLKVRASGNSRRRMPFRGRLVFGGEINGLMLRWPCSMEKNT